MKEYIFKQYLENILEHLDISIDELFQKTQVRNIVEGRQMLYYLCNERGMGITEIKTYMEKHGFKPPKSTILYGIAKAKEIIENDSDYHYIVKKLENIEL